MKRIISKVKNFFIKKEDEVIGDKFIEIMEIIYALILACGVVKIVEIFQKGFESIPKSTWFSISIAILVLIRFFFAPSKNIKKLGEKAKGWKWSIMPVDGTVLITHSFIFYHMCLNIEDLEVFYKSFFLLLFVNAFWLLSIWLRLSKEKITYIKIWCLSNFIFYILYLLTYKIDLNFWITWFILALINSLIDVITTYSDYFKD